MLCVSLTIFGLSYHKRLVSCELSLSNKLPYYFFFIVYIIIISYNLTWSNRAATLPCPYGLHKVSMDNLTFLWWQSSGLDWMVSESQLHRAPWQVPPAFSSFDSCLYSRPHPASYLIEPMKDSGYTEQQHLWVWLLALCCVFLLPYLVYRTISVWCHVSSVCSTSCRIISSL